MNRFIIQCYLISCTALMHAWLPWRHSDWMNTSISRYSFLVHLGLFILWLFSCTLQLCTLTRCLTFQNDMCVWSRVFQLMGDKCSLESYSRIYNFYKCISYGVLKNETSLMMTSSDGNIFRVTSFLCGKFTGDRWILRTKARGTELWCFLWSAP